MNATVRSWSFSVVGDIKKTFENQGIQSRNVGYPHDLTLSISTEMTPSNPLREKEVDEFELARHLVPEE